MVVDAIDRDVRVEIDPGGASAVLVISGESAASPPGVEVLGAIVAGAGVALTPRVRAAIEAARSATPGPDGVLRVEVARAEPARHGSPGRFDLDNPGERAACPWIVRAGDRLGTLAAATPGADGLDVLGRVIPAREGTAYELGTDASIEIAPDGSVYARTPGVVEWRPPLLRVVSVLDVPEVTPAQAIEFDGDVRVSSRVPDGAAIKATRDVTVAGLVEATRLVAARDAALNGGMAARGKGSLTAGRDARATYMDSVMGKVGRDLHVEKELVGCVVAVGRAVHAPDAGIIGGEATVGGPVRAASLGGESGVQTIVRAGHIEQLELVAAELASALPALEARVAKAQHALDQIKTVKGKPTAQHAEELTEREYELSAAKSSLEKALAALERVRRTAEKHAVVDVQIRDRVYAGVRVVAGRGEVRFKRELRGPVRISLGPDGMPRVGLPGGGEASAREHGCSVLPVERAVLRPPGEVRAAVPGGAAPMGDDGGMSVRATAAAGGRAQHPAK